MFSSGVCTEAVSALLALAKISVTDPTLPKSLHGDALLQNHDAPTAGHQGFERTLARLKLNAYWVSMTRDFAENGQSVSNQN